MQEGESKGFSDLPLLTIQKMAEMCLKANQYEEDLRKILKEIKEATQSNKETKPRVSIERLYEFQIELDQLNVWMSE